MERPYPPEVVKNKLWATVKTFPSDRGKMPVTQIDKNLKGLMAGQMAKALGGGDYGKQGRHVALEFLFNVQSSNDLDMAQIRAVLRWLVGPKDFDGKYTYMPYAAAELQEMVREILKVKGQLELCEVETVKPPVETHRMPEWMGTTNIDPEQGTLEM